VVPLETHPKEAPPTQSLHDAGRRQQTDGGPRIFDGQALRRGSGVSLVHLSVLLRDSLRLGPDSDRTVALLLGRQIQSAEKVLDFVGRFGKPVHESSVSDVVYPNPQTWRRINL